MYHFKDSRPMATVQRIMAILSDIGIEVEHHEIYSGVGELYSYRVEVKGSNGAYGTNGKGISREYALASAYAEFLERMQNNLLFLAIRDAAAEHGFYYSIDEREFALEELAELESEFLARIIVDIGDSCSVLEHLQRWSFLYPNQGRVITFPFKDHMSGYVHYLPIHIIKVYMGSNGMCAGNGMAEALVQGISELFERYAMKRLLSEGLTMPQIPEGEFSCYVEFYELVQEFRSKTGFELNFYDASLGEGLPVVAAICIDKEQQRYHVHFGAHPLLEVALERSLTELMQGQSLSSMSNFMEFGIVSCNKASGMSNRVQMYIDGVAYSPLQFFKSKPSYEYQRFDIANDSSNEKLLEFLLGKIANLGWNVLCRDTGFSGFNSYQVYVDCMSIYKYDDKDIKLPELLRLHDELFTSIKSIASADNRTLRRVLHLLKKFEGYNIRKRYPLLTNGFLRIEHGYGLTDSSVVVLFILLKLGKLRKAWSYLQGLEDAGVILDVRLRALKEYLAGIATGYSHEELVDVLARLYGVASVSLLESVHAGDVLKRLPQINCFACAECEYSQDCVYEVARKCRDKYFSYLLRESEVSQCRM